MKDIKMIVAKNLKKFREKKGMTQKELADILGTQNTTISAWENGQNSIDVTILFRIGEILNIPINEFYGIDKEFEKEGIDIIKKALVDFDIIKDEQELTDEKYENLMKFIKANWNLL